MAREYLIELYRRLAPIYEEVYGVEQRLKYWLILSQVGEKVVDAGCGVGLAFEVLKSYVVCLDISLDMLERARAKSGEWGDLILADYWLPPFRENAFISALFISSVEPELFEKLHAVWRHIAYKFFYEFRGKWRIFEQRN